MSRRTWLALVAIAPLIASEASASATADALLVGDSHAFQLGPRLGREARARARTLQVRGMGGTSARQWLERGWFKRAVKDHPSSVVLVSLGTNCVKSERKRLARDFAKLAAIIDGRTLIVLEPPTRAFPTSYIRAAAREAALAGAPVEYWDIPRGLALDPDEIHATDAGLRTWAAELADRLWPLRSKAA